MIGYALAFMVGGTVGVVIMAALNAASRASREEEARWIGGTSRPPGWPEYEDEDNPVMRV